MEVSSDIKKPWFEWLLLQGNTGLLDMQFLEASKYAPTAAPIFADLTSSWPGRWVSTISPILGVLVVVESTNWV